MLKIETPNQGSELYFLYIFSSYQYIFMAFDA